MQQLVVSWLTLSFGLWISHQVIGGFRLEGKLGSFLLIGAVVGVLHFLFGWLIFGVLGIATLGIAFLLGFITRLVVTAIILKLADVMSSRLTIQGFFPAFLSACLLSLVSAGVDWLVY